MLQEAYSRLKAQVAEMQGELILGPPQIVQRASCGEAERGCKADGMGCEAARIVQGAEWGTTGRGDREAQFGSPHVAGTRQTFPMFCVLATMVS